MGNRKVEEGSEEGGGTRTNVLQVKHRDSIWPDGGGVFSLLDDVNCVFDAKGRGRLIKVILMDAPIHPTSERILGVGAEARVLLVESPGDGRFLSVCFPFEVDWLVWRVVDLFS